MIRNIAALRRKPDQHRVDRGRAPLSRRLAASPWILSCTSFAMTAVLMGSGALTVF